MSQNPSHQTRHNINWRAAAIIEGQAQPVYGHAVEVSDSSVVITFEKPFRIGMECRIYLDVPDPDNGRPVYLDFRVKVQEASLMGQVSLFRHVMQISNIKPEQQAFLKRILNA